jgi:hypothetical protein
MPRRYTPRRANAKWREDAPAVVLDCFDHPDYADRFTIYTTERADDRQDGYGAALMYFGSGADPRGISYWGESPSHQVAAFRYGNARRRVRWLDLPDVVRAAFLRSIN